MILFARIDPMSNVLNVMTLFARIDPMSNVLNVMILFVRIDPMSNVLNVMTLFARIDLMSNVLNVMTLFARIDPMSSVLKQMNVMILFWVDIFVAVGRSITFVLLLPPPPPPQMLPPHLLALISLSRAPQALLKFQIKGPLSNVCKTFFKCMEKVLIIQQAIQEELSCKK
jgi:hypothetical protein